MINFAGLIVPFFVPGSALSFVDSEPTFGAKGMALSPIFGASPEDAVRLSHIQSTPMVPAVLFRCAEYLEAKGIDEVGLYRYDTYVGRTHTCT